MRVARVSDTMLPFTELMSIGGSADVNTSIFVMEASYRNAYGTAGVVTPTSDSLPCGTALKHSMLLLVAWLRQAELNETRLCETRSRVSRRKPIENVRKREPPFA